MSDSLSAEFPSPPDLDEIRERFTAAFVKGRFFPEGHECSPYIRLANDVQPLLREVERLQAGLAGVRQLVDQQAEDAGLWFFARTADEAYVQQELRKLHAAVEALARDLAKYV